MAQEQSMAEFSEDFKKPSHSTKTTIFFGFGAMTDQMSHQMFQFLIFTYYYAIVHIDLTWIMITFIILWCLIHLHLLSDQKLEVPDTLFLVHLPCSHHIEYLRSKDRSIVSFYTTPVLKHFHKNT